ncbi:hypothetical protein [Streptomyces sp. NPDC058861]|uniref:hypothetical protein n=1 Tax=Streptomyces sp. NPDC058861 TaxID=3346653 RepID=UPI003678733E
MSDHDKAMAVSISREWRGNNKTYVDSYRRYDFPVTVRKVGDDQQHETFDR